MKKLTQGQLDWLRDCRAGRDPINRFIGRSGHGGATSIRASLFRRGLIDVTMGITKAGRQALRDKVAPLPPTPSIRRPWLKGIAADAILAREN